MALFVRLTSLCPSLFFLSLYGHSLVVFKWEPLLLADVAVLLPVVGGQLDTFYFSVMPQHQDVVEGTETRIRCDVSDRRHVFFQWTEDGRPVRNTSRRFQEDSNLRILRVLRSEDSGLFQCTATNATTRFSLQSNEAKLNIQCKYTFCSSHTSPVFPVCLVCIIHGSWDSLLVRAPDLRSKGCEFESRQERRENFLLQSQLCVLTLYSVSVTPPCYRSGT